MTATYPFSSATPLGTAAANTLETVLQEDKAALNERLALEHESLLTLAGDDTGGRHKAGQCRVVYIGAYASLPTGTTGAIAYDTTNNCWRLHNGTNWTTYVFPGSTGAGLFSFRAYADSTQPNVATGTATKVQLAAEEFDYGSAWDMSGPPSYRFYPQVAGVYSFSGAVYYGSLGAEKRLTAYLYKNSSISIQGTTARAASSAGTYEACSQVSGMISLSSTDYVHLYVVHNNGSDIILPADARTFLCGHLVHRV